MAAEDRLHNTGCSDLELLSDLSVMPCRIMGEALEIDWNFHNRRDTSQAVGGASLFLINMAASCFSFFIFWPERRSSLVLESTLAVLLISLGVLYSPDFQEVY